MKAATRRTNFSTLASNQRVAEEANNRSADIPVGCIAGLPTCLAVTALAELAVSLVSLGFSHCRLGYFLVGNKGVR